MQYAEVVPDITSGKLNRLFTYRIPEHLSQVLRIGMEVTVPFGRGNRETQGYVVSLSDESPYAGDGMKEILSVAENRTAIEGKLVTLASWMAANYGSTLIQALKTVLPAKKAVKPVVVRTVRLAAKREEAEEFLALCRKKNHKARARLTEELIKEKEIPYTILTQKLHVTKAVMEPLREKGIIEILEAKSYRSPAGIRADSEAERADEDSVQLTAEQKEAADEICGDLAGKDPKTWLLYGVTGSGKTEVYMRAIRQVIRDGGQAIVLIPEIALTYQTVMRFRHRFGDRVSIMHSRLSDGERYDQYLRAKNGEIDVVIGPRSALFTPFPNLKLIVIDEEHETTYKSEHSPRYHAREVAIHRAKEEGAGVILGSATPSIESFFLAKNGVYRLLRMQSRIGERRLADVTLVDLRDEIRSGNRSIISAALDEKIRERLKRHEQIMLFLNRRGYAGFVACRECGEVMMCPHCDVSLSQHLGGKLVCHYCGYERKLPPKCPKCGSPYIGGFRAGTEQIEQLLASQYPEASILRMDMDTTRGKEGHARILSKFGNEEADILLGTQMIVKGHDFPGVTLVGILAADLSLFTGGFRAAERTFQLLTQAAGRAGRGDKRGEVVIQTYQPDHYAVRTACDQDYEAFYEQEILYREMMSYPPAAHMLGVMISGKDEELVAKAAEYMRQNSEAFSQKRHAEIFGPGSPYVGKLKDVYRKVLFYKAPEYDTLVAIKDFLTKYVGMNSGFSDLFVQFDFDG